MRKTQEELDALAALKAGFSTIADYYRARIATLQAENQALRDRHQYICGGCGVNAWAKPDATLKCGACEMVMQPADGSREERIIADGLVGF
jgi:hypothetical protein